MYKYYTTQFNRIIPTILIVLKNMVAPNDYLVVILSLVLGVHLTTN